jgi:hypothetical protein
METVKEYPKATIGIAAAAAALFYLIYRMNNQKERVEVAVDLDILAD